jgi:hypothetical protein
MSLLKVQRSVYINRFEGCPNMADDQSCTHDVQDFSNLPLAAVRRQYDYCCILEY